jgi:hypothetical protein
VPCEYLDFGEYVIGRTVARRGSGVETSSEGDTWLFRFRDGEAIEYHECEGTQEALDAVGAGSS